MKEQIPLRVWLAVSSIISEKFQFESCHRLESRRNQVYKIRGVIPPRGEIQTFVAKWFQQPGIAHEASILQDALARHVAVPRVLGTTSDVLLMDYIEGTNLCDLITENPKLKYARLLGHWLVHYHTAFQRTEKIVLLKGDVRIRNFILTESEIVGVDFEECHPGFFLEDIAIACASILDTNPMFTRRKLKLCRELIKTYSKAKQLGPLEEIVQQVVPLIIEALDATALRRGQPDDLVAQIGKFKAGSLIL